ncbi:MAG: hypothetical protein RI932_329, partial [Pseudomonadota bacterium]
MTLTNDDWLSLQSTGPSDVAVQNLLSCSAPAEENPPADVVVGGGLAGLLLALKLSSSGCKAPLVVLESRPTLGGRLFQSPPLLPGVTRAEALRAQFKQEALQHCSGPGFELFDPLALEVYERHLRMLLTESEQEFLEGFVNERSPAEEPFARRTLLVRKEMTPLTEALSGSSEMLTRKEAEILLQLAQPENISPENDGPFEATAFWQGLSKAQRESLTPLLETVLGWTLDRTPVSVVRSAVHAFVKSNESELPKLFLRTSRLELGLEIVLLSRGVRVLTQAELVRAVVPEKKATTTLIQVADVFARAPQQMTVRKLALAIPLMRSLSVLPREQLHPQQSRLVSRHRPRSLVWVEYGHWRQALLSTISQESLVPGTRLVCPVERVQGALLSNGQLGFYTSIDFEDSLHA